VPLFAHKNFSNFTVESESQNLCSTMNYLSGGVGTSGKAVPLKNHAVKTSKKSCYQRLWMSPDSSKCMAAITL
jgi:hypothetical protein